MRWNVRVAALPVVAVLLLAPFSAQAASSRAGDSPPLDGAATTATVPADPPPGQVVTIFVPSEPAEPPPPSKPKPSAATVPPAVPPAPVAPPPAPPVATAPRTKAPVGLPRVSARGGASTTVAAPARARGGASFVVPVARSRHTESLVSAVLASGGGAAGEVRPGRATSGWLTVLAVAVFVEALLITRTLRRRPASGKRSART